MKIGILTYHSVPNFGAQLQTLSMVGFFLKKGYDSVVINWYPEDLKEMYAQRIPQQQMDVHESFANENIPMTRLCQTSIELINIIKEYDIDVVVIGSDAVFKYVPKSLRKHFSLRKFRMIRDNILSVEEIRENPFWGTFYENVEKEKKIKVFAFSASSQNCQYMAMSTEEVVEMRAYLRHFSNITVRDTWTKEMVEFITGKTAIKITPDPVFAFNNNNYLKIPSKKYVIEKYHIPENYVLLSFRTSKLSGDYIKSIVEESKRRGMSPVGFPMPEGLKDIGVEYNIELPLSPIDWYSLIIYSNGYIGERMHPILVCLHNVVPFFSFDEYGILKRYAGGLIRKKIIESSKTYHILKEAKLLSNYCSYFSSKKKPCANQVVDLLVDFNYRQCELFSEKMKMQFFTGIQSITDMF